MIALNKKERKVVEKVVDGSILLRWKMLGR